MIGWENRVVDTSSSYILSETWSYDSADSLTTNQQSQVIVHIISDVQIASKKTVQISYYFVWLTIWPFSHSIT